MSKCRYEHYFDTKENMIIKVMGVEEIMEHLTEYYEEGMNTERVRTAIRTAYRKIFLSHEKIKTAERKE